LRNGLPLRSVINIESQEMGKSKITEEYYDFDAAIEIEVPKCN
jgi:hypothetical protein